MTVIQACVDRSVATGPVLRAAASLARLFGATVEAVHVPEGEVAAPLADAEVAGVPLRLQEGDVVGVLVRLGARPDVEAVAVGARSRVTSGTIGHVTRALATTVDRPVLVVPPEAEVPDRFGRVLVAMKGTPTNAIRLQQAIQLAVDADLEVVAVHVDDESTIPSFSDQVQHETDAYASEFLSRYAPGTTLASFEPRIGVPAEEILAVADAVRPDAIAVGRRVDDPRGLGTVLRRLLERSHVPVLVVATD